MKLIMENWRKTINEQPTKFAETEDEKLIMKLTGGDMGDVLTAIETSAGERPAESEFVRRAKQYVSMLGPQAMDIHQKATKGMSVAEIADRIMSMTAK